MTEHFLSSEANFSPCGPLASVQHPLGVAVSQEPDTYFRLLTRNGCFRWKLLLCSLEVTESCLFIYHKPPVVQDILSCLTFYVSLKVEAVLDFRSLGLVC